MDRNYYYRILGLRSDATPAQIRDAYNIRMARLDSADFADEPEYARRKKAQVTQAYKVLMGVAPAATAAQKESRFERHKDRIERREGFEKDPFDEETGSKFKFSLPNINIGKKAVKTKADKAKLTVAGTAITILITIIGLFSAIGDLVADDNGFDYSDFYYQDEVYAAEDLTMMFDYSQNLDPSTAAANQDNIDWYVGVDEYGVDTLSTDMMDVLYWFGIYDVDEFFGYATGYEDYYMESDDYDCAVALIDWLNAPAFEDVAGQTNLYNGEVILSIADYMEYLEEFVYEHV